MDKIIEHLKAIGAEIVTNEDVKGIINPKMKFQLVGYKINGKYYKISYSYGIGNFVISTADDKNMRYNKRKDDIIKYIDMYYC